MNQGWATISSFKQGVDKCLSEAWDRYQDLPSNTPIHGFNDALQINMFLDGFITQSKLMLDASAGGKIALKTLSETYELIDNMASNDHEIQHEWILEQRKGIF